MRLTARLTAREAAHVVAEGRTAGRMGPGRPESVHLEVAPPTPLDTWRREAGGRRGDRARNHASVDRTRDLGPARGMVTAIGLGVALWLAIIVVVRAVIV